MSKPLTPAEKAWDRFSEGCHKLGLTRLKNDDLESLAADSLTLERELSGLAAPEQSTITARRLLLAERVGRLKGSMRKKRDAGAYLKALSGIHDFTTRLGIDSKYSKTAMLLLLETIPTILSQKDFYGAPAHTLSQIERMVTERTEYYREGALSLTSSQIGDDDKKELRNTLGEELVAFFNPSRYDGQVGKGTPQTEEVTSPSELALAYLDFAKREEDKERKGRKRGILKLASAAVALAFAVGVTDYNVSESYEEKIRNLEGKLAAAQSQKDIPPAEKRSGKTTLVPEYGCPEPAPCSPAQACPRNVQREYFDAFSKVFENMGERGRYDTSVDDQAFQEVVDRFRAGLTEDYIISGGGSLIGLMLGPKSDYSAAEQERYDQIRGMAESLVPLGHLRTSTSGRKQNIGDYILQPTQPNSGGK